MPSRKRYQAEKDERLRNSEADKVLSTTPPHISSASRINTSDLLLPEGYEEKNRSDRMRDLTREGRVRNNSNQQIQAIKRGSDLYVNFKTTIENTRLSINAAAKILQPSTSLGLSTLRRHIGNIRRILKNK